ncbi:hypothetical protein GGS20DRAFT_587886 [Poronia punctata]|nr:hypothetical protein GGS20DRAFT_587886 [Poronia punctata]
MASPRDIAKQNWEQAQKIRSSILTSLSALKKERGPIQYTTHFQAAEETIAEFRLACLQVIINDFEYAVGKKVEHSLWQCHTFLNGEYRRALGRLNTQSQVVQRRKLDKLYRTFLKISEKFYVVYIQQLHQRFSIPELQQLARGTETQDKKAQNVVPAPLRTLALKSCQTTLVHLGDLARYQCQASDKVAKPIFDRAISYYDLANTLDPEDGSAHHQLAILHQVVDQHFDIVYHFHRAISVPTPHQLALQNLKQEFKHPEGPPQSKKGPARDRFEAMVTWFVRLHAFYFHGKQFSAQSELEDEVLHRVELALKSDGTDTLLLKMILINMAAYDIASEKVKTSWTMEGSQSCQFLLRFNVRIMLTLLRVLQHTLRDEQATPPAPATGASPDNGESPVCFGPGLLKLLPFCRLYVAWTYTARADLVQYQEYLEPHIQEIYGLLADVLTSLNLFVDPTMRTTSSKYLLPEDVEAQGLRPLIDKRLPLFLQVEEQQTSGQPKRVKTRKPQKSVSGRNFKPETEAVWRIRDIICCGAFLAGSAKFPLILSVRKHEGREVEAWQSADAPAALGSPAEVILSRLLRKLGFGELKKEEPTKEPDQVVVQEEPRVPSAEDTSKGHTPVSEDTGRVSATHSNRHSNSGSAKANYHDQPSTAYRDSDPSENTDMIDMVNKLLDPLEEERPGSSHVHNDSSYGMHSATANEIFGGLEAGPAQPSPVSKTIPNLPWDYFYKPAPHRSNSHEQSQMGSDTSNGLNVPRSAAASSPYLGNLSATFDRNLPHGLSPRLNAGRMRDSPTPNPPSPAISRKQYGTDTLEGSRNAVLDSLTSALLAQHGLSRNSVSPNSSNLHRTNVSQIWPEQSAAPEPLGPHPAAPTLSAGSRRDVASNYYDRLANYQARTAASSRSPPGLGVGGAHVGLGHVAQTPAPAHYASNAWGSGPASVYPYHRGSPWQDSTAIPSSMPFSHPSSLFGGTPGAVSAAPANSVACNGNYYNATTPFSRLGEGVNNREDPTHFRNKLKAVTGTSELSYDQQVLQAAMMDDNYKPRPR